MKKILLFSAVFIFLAGLGWGQVATFIWTGTNGNDWNDSGNWEDELGNPVTEYPGKNNINDIVIIGNGANVNLSASLNALGSLTIDNGASLDIGAFDLVTVELVNGGELKILGNLTVTNSFVNSGNLTLTGESQTVTIPSTPSPVGGTVTYDYLGGSDTDFAGLKDFTNLEIKNGARKVTDAITVSVKFSLLDGLLEATSIEIMGTSNIDADITTTGDQTYSGAVTLDGAGTRILTSTGGSITADGVVTGTDITVNASQGISLNAANELSGNITLNNTQTGNTPAGDIIFNNTNTTINLTADNSSAAGNIAIVQSGDLSITSLKTGTTGSVTITATGEITQTGAIETDDLKVLAGTGIIMPMTVNKVVTSVELTTAAGNISFTDGNAGKLIVKAEASSGDVTITKIAGALEIGGINANGDVSLKADGNVTQTAVINADNLKVETDAGITLNENNVVNAVILKSSAVSSAQGNITYVNSIGAANTLEVTVVTIENVTITETTGAIDVNDIASGVNINLTAKTNIDTKGINVSGIVNLKAVGDITINGDMDAYQLIAETIGNVNIGAFTITTTSTGYENTSAAIYLKANNFIVVSGTAISPGGSGGQLCLDLNHHWDDFAPPNNVVNGLENIRWHQHYLNLAGMHLVYGIDSLGLAPGPYIHIQDNDVKTSFDLYPGFNVYINDAVNTNVSGVSFKTSGGGSIHFSGTNTFEKITLETTGTGVIEFGGTNGFANITLTAGSGGVKLVDTEITVNGDFEINEKLSLDTDALGESSIEAEKIILNDIAASNNEKLTLTSTTGDVEIKGTVGTSPSAYLGDITVDSVGSVTFSGAVFANSIDVTNAGTTIIGANIDTTGAQTYGAVTLGGDVTLAVGTTVTMGTITGDNHALTITGNGELNGVSGITNLSVSGTSKITGDITTTGDQTYTGAVTLGDDVNFTSTAGRTVRFDNTVNGSSSPKDLKITNANAVFIGTVGAPFSSLINSVTVTTGTAGINADITTTGNQTYNGNVTFGGAGTRTLDSTGGNISITQTGGLSLGTLTATNGSISIKSTGAVTQTGTITTGTLTLSGPGSYVLNSANNVSTIETTAPDPASIEYTNSAAVTNGTLTLGHMTVPSTVSTGIITIHSGKNISVNADINAYQLILITSGEVIVTAMGKIETTSTGNQGTNAAIYIEAADFNVTSAGVGSIVPGDRGVQWGQLCLVLEKSWTDQYPGGVVDGDEDHNPDNPAVTGHRWHQHFINLSVKHLVYGAVPSDFSLSPSDYELVPANNINTTFNLGSGKSVYINDANNINPSGLVFKTSGGGFIEFSGANSFVKITLETAGGGIKLVDTSITVSGNFELTEGITLETNSPPGTGSIINAANITLNGITATSNENLTLTSTSGNINVNGPVGASGASVGDINASASKVALSGAIYAKGIDVTSTDIAVNADITTLEDQTYTGAVTLGGAGARTLTSTTGTTISLGMITGANLALTINGNGTLNGGSDIGDLTVNGNFTLTGGTLNAASVTVNTGTSNISGIITTATGKQTYGAVTLANTVTLAGTTVTLGAIDGTHALTINGVGVFNNGGTNIGDLTVNGNFTLTGGTLNAVSVIVNGTSNIATDITTTGAQAYTGAVTLGGTGTRTITSTTGTVTLGNITGDAHELIIKGNGTLNGGTGIGDLTVSGNFTLSGGTLNAASVTVNTGTSTISGNITTTGGNQTYAAVTLGNTVTLAGTIEMIGTITGAHALTIDGDGVFNNGGTGIGALQVNGDFDLAGGNLDAASVDVTGTSNITGNVTTNGGNQTYKGNVTLVGTNETRILTGTIETLGTIIGNGNSLTITENGTIHGGSDIGDLTVNGNFTLANADLSATSVSVTGTSNIATDVTTTGMQTYTGDVTLGGTGLRTLTSTPGTTISLGNITGANHALTINGVGVFNNGGTGIGALQINGNFDLAGGNLSAASVEITGTSTIDGNITTSGKQTYAEAVTLTGSNSTIRTITSQGGDIDFNSKLTSTAKIELIATGGKITVGDTITAYQLIAKAIGTVTVADITINSYNTGNDGINAAIFIEADNLITTIGKSIVPGGRPPAGPQWGQLCLVLNVDWEDTNGVVDGDEDTDPNLTATDYRWHKHFIDLSGKHLVYGVTEPSGFSMSSSEYELVHADNIKTIFVLGSGKNVYINGANNTNPSGLVFKTKGEGVIEFSGTNSFEKITLDTAGGGIKLVDTSITVNDDFELTEGITLETSSLPSTGSSIEAANITLNVITAISNENLTLKSTSGNINVNGPIGANGASVGDINASAGDVTFSGTIFANIISVPSTASASNVALSGAIYAKSIDVTSTDIAVNADITTSKDQTYTGAVTLGGAVTLTSTSGTVKFDTIDGADNALTINGVGVFNNGGTNIGDLKVNGNFDLTGDTLNALSVNVTGTSNIAKDIITNGTQIYGEVILGDDVTLEGTTLTMENITGTPHNLIIKGDGVLNGGGIGVLSISKNFKLTGGTLNATSVDVIETSTIDGNITTTGTQTYGAVTLGGVATLVAGTTVTMGNITGADHALTITGDGTLNGGGTEIGALTVNGNFTLAGGDLNAASVNVTVISSIDADITTTGAQTYTGAVTLGSTGTRTITSQSGDIEFMSTLTFTGGVINLSAANITISGQASANQLIAKAPSGTVSVNAIYINLSNTGNEGENAAIYIEANIFEVTATATDSIVPGGTGGQLCLVVKNRWEDTFGFVDGPEDTDPDNLGTVLNARWHQHFIVVLTDKHLIYGKMFSVAPPLTSYVFISDENDMKEFILNEDYNIYIYNVEITPQNSSGLTFTTSGTGSITFLGANEFTNITLTAGSGGVKLVDTEITVTDGDFVLNSDTGITLASNSPPGTGSSITAANITLNSINTVSEENLTLTSTSGAIVINGAVGAENENIGDITVISADNVTFSGNVYAEKIDVTSTGVISIGADITTDTNQTYSGQVELDGTGNRILTGATITLDAVTGNTHSLTITGNGVLNGGSGINDLTVSGDFKLSGNSLTAATVSIEGESDITADITSAGNQIYTGAVTLNGSPRTITSQSGNIEYKSMLILTGDIIKLLAANIILNDITATTSIEKIALEASGDITINGNVTAGQLIAKAQNGTVTVNAIKIDSSNTGNEGEGAAIYIEAVEFIVIPTAAAGSIIPGGRPAGAQWGQLCLVLNNKWIDANNVVDGPEDIEPLGSVPGARWHQHITIVIEGEIIYSFTEDSNGNGRLDRIRVQTNVALNGDFNGFDVSITGYEIDRSKGNITKGAGFDLVSTLTGKTPFDDDSFYIYLKEKPENDGGNTPLWSILSNTSLKDNRAVLVGDPAVDNNIKPIDTVPPRIEYTLTLPNHPQIFILMAEPIVPYSSTDISATFKDHSIQGISRIQPDGLGYLFNLSGSLKIEDLAKNIDSPTLENGYFQMDNIADREPKPDWSTVDPMFPPKYPLNWGYTEYAKVKDDSSPAQSANGTVDFSAVFTPPNRLLSADMMGKLATNQGSQVTPNNDPVIRRVTDVLVSMSPANANSDSYFAWPVWARFKKSLNAPYAAGNDVFWGQQPTDTGIIWQFDGTNFLESSFIDSNEGLELQARINDNLTDAPELFWTTADVPAEYRNPNESTEDKKTGGLWLPNVLSLQLYNYVPMSDGVNGKPADSASSKLFNYNIPPDGLVTGSVSKLEFIFRLSNASDQFIARLDIPKGGVIPANWYALIRPFAFEIRNIRRQRGGVTIMNNVINSNNRETAFIRYHLLRPGRVTVQVYTLDGTLVKSLRRNEQRAAGEWTDAWDGTNNGGRAVARGMYFVRIVGPDIDEIRKIMVVK